jgi:hypothetical protein
MGIRVNFTDTEKYGRSSLGMDPLPTGKYHVAITDAEMRESGPNAKNPGSEYINFEFTVQSGQYEGRKLWTNASLLPQALYTIKGVLEATGHDTAGNELDFELDDLVNEELIVRVVFKKAGKVTYNGEERELDDRNEVKSFYRLTDEAAKSGSTSGGSLLP